MTQRFLTSPEPSGPEVLLGHCSFQIGELKNFKEHPVTNATLGAKPDLTVEGFKIHLLATEVFLWKKIPQGEFIKEDTLHLSLY